MISVDVDEGVICAGGGGSEKRGAGTPNPTMGTPGRLWVQMKLPGVLKKLQIWRTQKRVSVFFLLPAGTHTARSKKKYRGGKYPSIQMGPGPSALQAA